MTQQRRNRMAAAILGALVLAATLVPAGRADGFRNPPDGALALGRIGGRIADVDDATAVSHNPANLVGIRKPTVQPSVTIGYCEKEFTDALGRATTSEDPWRLLPSLYAAMPLKPGVLTLGAAVTVPYGQSTRWDEYGPLRYKAPHYARMTVLDVTPSVGVRIADRLSVGAGLDLYRGDVKFQQAVPWALASRNPVAPDGVMTLEGDGTAVGGNLGATLKLTDSQRVAFTYKLPFDVDCEGSADLTGVPPGLPALASTDFSTTFRFPQIAAVGYSVRLTETVRVEANVEWLQHSRNDVLDLDVGANNALLNSLGTNSMVQDWKDTWTFGVGADWEFAPNWQLRAGYLYMPTPVPQHALIPSAAERDQTVVSLGLGWRSSRHSVDAALAQGFFRRRDVDGNQNPDYNGDYRFRSTLLGLTYGYAF